MIYFLSDAHLGSHAIANRAAHQRHFLQLLDRLSQDASAIYLLGDIFDFWYEYLWHDTSKDEYKSVIDTLCQLTSRGIAVHYFIGNHDIWTFGQLEQQTGVILHRTPMEEQIGSKTFFLAHGDGLVPTDYIRQLPKAIQRKIQRFKALRAFFHNPIPQFLYRLLPPPLGNAFGYEWARRSRMKELQHPCAYKGEEQEELVLYAKEQEQQGKHRDYYIFGHRHIELDLQLKQGSRVIILGDCFQQWTYAALTEQGEIQLCTDSNE